MNKLQLLHSISSCFIQSTLLETEPSTWQFQRFLVHPPSFRSTIGSCSNTTSTWWSLSIVLGPITETDSEVTLATFGWVWRSSISSPITTSRHDWGSNCWYQQESGCQPSTLASKSTANPPGTESTWTDTAEIRWAMLSITLAALSTLWMEWHLPRTMRITICFLETVSRPILAETVFGIMHVEW